MKEKERKHTAQGCFKGGMGGGQGPHLHEPEKERKRPAGRDGRTARRHHAGKGEERGVWWC